MPINLTTVSQVTQTQGFKVLVYAGPGTGKTVLAATMGPGSFLVGAESGELSLRRANLERIYGVGNPWINYDMPMAKINTVQDFLDVLRWLQQSHEARQYHSVGVDSISEIAEIILNNAKRASKDPRQAYGVLTETLETLVRAYRDLPGRNVYVAAKMAPMKDEATGMIKYLASMPGQRLGPALPYFFDEVFRLGMAKTPEGIAYRFLQTQPDIQFDAKDRSGVLAPIEEPHLGKIFQKMLGA